MTSRGRVLPLPSSSREKSFVLIPPYGNGVPVDSVENLEGSLDIKMKEKIRDR
jgi:hypothetical protein